MERIFAVDGKLNTLLGRVADLVILNLLWLLCSLPIMTLGASTAALYSVLLKVVRNEEAYVFSGFFKAFRENIRQATAVWLGIMLAAVILYFDFYFCGHMEGTHIKLLIIPVGMTAFLIAVLYGYIFPVLAYFENSTKKAVKNALLMGIAYLPYTMVILLVNFCPLYLFAAGNPAVALFLDLVIGFSLPAYINSYIFRRLFDKVHVG